MQVKYNKKAVLHITSTVDYYLSHFGKQATMLRKYPEIGFPEPLLSGRNILYRAPIVGRYHKIIYYVKGNTLRIAAFWDMRMSPETLKGRI